MLSSLHVFILLFVLLCCSSRAEQWLPWSLISVLTCLPLTCRLVSPSTAWQNDKCHQRICIQLQNSTDDENNTIISVKKVPGRIWTKHTGCGREFRLLSLFLLLVCVYLYDCKCMCMQACLTIFLEGNVIRDLEEIEPSLIDLSIPLSLCFPFLRLL